MKRKQRKKRRKQRREERKRRRSERIAAGGDINYTSPSDSESEEHSPASSHSSDSGDSEPSFSSSAKGSAKGSTAKGSRKGSRRSKKDPRSRRDLSASNKDDDSKRASDLSANKNDDMLKTQKNPNIPKLDLNLKRHTSDEADFERATNQAGLFTEPMDTERRNTHNMMKTMHDQLQNQQNKEAELQKKIDLLMASNAKLCEQMQMTLTLSARGIGKASPDEEEKDLRNLEALVGKDKDDNSNKV